MRLLTLTALLSLGLAAGGCSYTERVIGGAAIAGVAAGATSAIVSHSLAADGGYQEASYRPLRPGDYCRWQDGGPGRLVYHPGSPNNLRCMCWPPGRVTGGGYGPAYGGSPAYGYRPPVVVRPTLLPPPPPPRPMPPPWMRRWH